MKCLLLFFSISVLKCCGIPSKTLQLHKTNTENLMPLNSNYQINNLNSKDVSSLKLNITFIDSTKQVSVFSGCNRFLGNYELSDNHLKFEKMASTRMLCNNEANQIESQLLQALDKVNSFSIKNNTLEFRSDGNIVLEASKEKPLQQLTAIEYTASSRGSYQKIIAHKTGISKSIKRGKNGVAKTYAISKWQKLQRILETIPLETIPNLEAPSKDFQFDGAAIAVLKIVSAGKTYETPSFDHGNPPKEIAELLKELVSISEMIE